MLFQNLSHSYPTQALTIGNTILLDDGCMGTHALPTRLEDVLRNRSLLATSRIEDDEIYCFFVCPLLETCSEPSQEEKWVWRSGCCLLSTCQYRCFHYLSLGAYHSSVTHSITMSTTPPPPHLYAYRISRQMQSTLPQLSHASRLGSRWGEADGLGEYYESYFRIFFHDEKPDSVR